MENRNHSRYFKKKKFNRGIGWLHRCWKHLRSQQGQVTQRLVTRKPLRSWVKEEKHSEARAVWHRQAVCTCWGKLWARTPPTPTPIARAHSAVTSVALLEMLPNQDPSHFPASSPPAIAFHEQTPVKRPLKTGCEKYSLRALGSSGAHDR